MVKDCIIKTNIVTVIFSDVESNHGESDSDSNYFEEPLKILSNTLDVKKPNLRDKNIIISIESSTTLITKFTVYKNRGYRGQFKLCWFGINF